MALMAVPPEEADTREKFLNNPRWVKGAKLTWQDKRDLEVGYARILSMHRQGQHTNAISAKLSLPIYQVKAIIQAWKAVEHYPSTPEVLKLRLSGRSITMIAANYGLTTDEVRQMLEGEIKQMEGPTGQMAIEVARTERYFEVLEPEIAKGNMTAIQLAIRISEHKMAVIQTQIETSHAISNAVKSLSDVLAELDAETTPPRSLEHEATLHPSDGPQEQSDDGSSPAASVEDC